MNKYEQNEEISMDSTHSLDEVLRLASLLPTDETPKTEDTFDIDGALA